MTSTGVGAAAENTRNVRNRSAIPSLPLGEGVKLCKEGGVAEVLSRWRIHSQEDPRTPRRPPITDFVALNTEAIKSGHRTAKQFRDYKAQLGAANTLPTPKTPRGRASQRPQIPDITFGMKNRASSPIFDILAHEYGRRWVQENIKTRSEYERRHTVKFPPFAHTRASILRTNAAPPLVTVHPHTRTRYAQIGPALDTCRKHISSTI
ncbi:cilia- and flagella-associated protein 77 [Corythoichthys intestinalis]|uniref:cilia- and flagella-associated protein 77 n=1 Tax=Corythoichthys intestinalis TaxID=161448 RepID=UPI0025A586A1|nr:cilia- and flagella-associated protein 77 [Corythoichthys intestinalis]XP_057688215.1 cilia- and flagella-associated protein 77 [Corythoichthys intestinalis]XP_061804470.1 cilia- and flagella-associated protein 77-like [Nerophis lumbriciformis]